MTSIKMPIRIEDAPPFSSQVKHSLQIYCNIKAQTNMNFNYPGHTRHHTTREDCNLPVSPWEGCERDRENVWNSMSMDVTSTRPFQQDTPPSRFAIMEQDHALSHSQAACDSAAWSHQSSWFGEQSLFPDNSGWRYNSQTRPSYDMISPPHPEGAHHIAMPSTSHKTYRVPKATSRDIEPNTPQSLSSPVGSLDSEAELVMIGSVYAVLGSDDYMFKCSRRECVDRTYSRWYDLKRHYEGAHAVNGAVFWCPAKGCERSQGRGNRPFPRKDKMRDHLRKKHKR